MSLVHKTLLQGPARHCNQPFSSGGGRPLRWSPGISTSPLSTVQPRRLQRPRHRHVIMASGKSALVPIANGSEEMEAVIIIDVLRRAGIDVTVASVEESLQVEMSRRVKLVADRLIGDCRDCSYDVVALPGGMPGAEALANSQALMDIVRAQKQSDKLWAAICAAPVVALEGNGLLEGKRATAHPAFSSKLSNQSDVASRVVVDGKLVTSRGPGTAFEFALALVAELLGPEKAQEVAGPMVMYPFQPSKAYAAAA